MNQLTVTIDRAHWLRGHNDPRFSNLLTESTEGARLQCCMGTACSARGISDDDLRGNSAVDEVFDLPHEPGELPDVDREWLWFMWDSNDDETLMFDRYSDHFGKLDLDTIQECYKVNDDPDLPEDEREAALILLCAPKGLDLVFVGEGHPTPAERLGGDEPMRTAWSALALACLTACGIAAEFQEQGIHRCTHIAFPDTTQVYRFDSREPTTGVWSGLGGPGYVRFVDLDTSAEMTLAFDSGYHCAIEN